METENKLPETDNTQTVNKQTTPVTPATPVVEQETQEQINWKKFREAREIERKQKEAAEKRANEKEQEAQALKAAMDALLNKPSNNHQTTASQEEDLSEDERIQKKVDEAIAVRDKKQQEENLRKEQAAFPHRLTQTFNDFNQVCSSENLDYLEYHYPEVANAFSKMPDGFDKWANVYKAVKRFVPNPDSKKEQAKAEKNFNKPQAMSIAGKTQVGDTAPHTLDDKRRQDNWARMQRVMKGGGV